MLWVSMEMIVWYTGEHGGRPSRVESAGETKREACGRLCRVGIEHRGDRTEGEHTYCP